MWEAEVLDGESRRANNPRNVFESKGPGKFASIAGINFGLISD
jgi:hypothetical protein